jgi:hypothetical protein
MCIETSLFKRVSQSALNVLVEHVCFPWITQAQLAAAISAEERASVARLPRYQGLVREAAEVHQRSVHQRKRPAEVAG